MAGERIQDGKAKAARVRAIVEAKESFVWATLMENLCQLFSVDHLGAQIVADMTRYLEEEGLNCFPSPAPSQKQDSVLIMVRGSKFARGFKSAKPSM